MLEDVKDTIRKASGHSNEYDASINILNQIIRETTLEERRKELSNSDDFFLELRDCAIIGKSTLLSEVCTVQYVRIVKAIVIISRNLSVENQASPQEILLPNALIDWYLSLMKQDAISYQDLKQIYVLICQFYFNCSRSNMLFDQSSFNSHMEFIIEMMKYVDHEDALYAFSLFLSKAFVNESFLSLLINDSRALIVIYELLIMKIIEEKTEIPSIIKSKVDETSELSTLATVQLKILKYLITHESFGSLMKKLKELYNEEAFNSVLNISTMLITSSDKWDLYQLTAISTWGMTFLEEYSDLVNKYFELELSDNPIDPSPIYKNLLSILDILTTLAQYQHVQKFLVSYEGLQKIITLFDILEKKCLKIQFNKPSGFTYPDSNIQLNMKATDNIGNIIKNADILNKRIKENKICDSNFPGIKCYLVELLGFMTYGQTEVQNLIRELHGLELVLSNCIIDDNNPFIKERSILCIRYLLADNQQNQDFITKLEAKKAVNDDVLEKAGYRMNVDGNGNVKLVSDDKNAVPESTLLSQIHKR